MPGPTPEQLRRIARRPSRFAPRLRDLHSPPADPDADLAEVADLSGVTRDEFGRITGAAMSARAFVSLAGRCPALTRVRLVGAAMILDEVLASPRLGRLVALSLAGCRVGDGGAAELASPSAVSLRHLDLGHNALTVAGVAALAAAPWAARLHSLGLAGSGHDGVIDAFGHVESFDLTESVVTPALWLRLAGSARNFDSLELAGCDLELADFGAPVRCRRLGLARNAVGDAGVARLAASGTLGGVEVLDLGVNRLTGAALGALAGRVPRLGWLNLAGNFLAARDLAILLDPEAFPRLRRVLAWPLR